MHKQAGVLSLLRQTTMIVGRGMLQDVPSGEKTENGFPCTNLLTLGNLKLGLERQVKINSRTESD
jgi:hypothetical protein